MSSHLGTIAESGMSDAQLIQDDNSDDVGFQYPNSDAYSDDSEEEEQFVYPGTAPTTEPAPTEPVLTESAPPVAVQSPSQYHPSPAQLESLYAAASSGDLILLQRLFKNALESGEVEPFALANDASSRTGLTALHAAASRGYLDIVRWLVEQCGAMPDLEDKEGETALHKASMNGHLPILKYLLSERDADVQARDADGWTALHNACSKGFLDIVRWLCEQGGATKECDGQPGIDIRSKGGWTPLMNASSKGHLPVVLYLLTKQAANPLVRNNWGETAYDAAAAVFEVWICQVLQKSEMDKWRGTTVPYDPLAVHTTVPLVLYENQRLDLRLKTLAVSGGRPKFSASGLGKQGRRAPFELKLPKMDEETRVDIVPAWRSDIQLPLLDDPWRVVATKASNGLPNHTEGQDRSHFWLSDWTLDTTHPAVDAEDGWQYARTFNDPDDQWVAERPGALERLLSGSGALTTGFGSSGSSSRRQTAGSSTSRSSSTRVPHTWVRRRRWVRVMRRRLDIPPLPFLQPDGGWYHFDNQGGLIPHVQESGTGGDVGGHGEGQEMGAMSSAMLSSGHDYVARARYLVGVSPREGDEADPVSMRRGIAKLERATTELRQGILAEDSVERRTQAEVLLNAYSRELERKRLAAGAAGLLITGEDPEYDDDEGSGDDSEEEFRYPGSQTTPRPSSIHSSTIDYFNRNASSSRAPTDLTPQLSQAPEFRVPTHEAPRKVVTPRWTPPSPHQIHAQWERDEAAPECRDCQRRFTFLLRRHCRRCGRIFCDRCSSQRALLDPSDIVQDPLYPENITAPSLQRTCRACNDEVNAVVPRRLQTRTTSMERIVVNQERLSIPIGRGESSSQLSDLAECPVCNQNLDELGDATEQEAHVKHCLDGGSGSAPQSAKYLVYKLPGESTLIGTECVICLEEFSKGSLVARLSCLCSFHNTCLSSWLQRGRSCPVHAR